jgi:hypothetical protein
MSRSVLLPLMWRDERREISKFNLQLVLFNQNGPAKADRESFEGKVMKLE